MRYNRLAGDHREQLAAKWATRICRAYFARLAAFAAIFMHAPPAFGRQPTPPESSSFQPGEPEEIQAEAETPERLTPAEARPAAEAYKLLYYDNDFTYLNDPSNREFYVGDVFKQSALKKHLVSFCV